MFNIADLTAGFEKLRAGRADREKVNEAREAKKRVASKTRSEDNE